MISLQLCLSLVPLFSGAQVPGEPVLDARPVAAAQLADRLEGHMTVVLAAFEDNERERGNRERPEREPAQERERERSVDGERDVERRHREQPEREEHAAKDRARIHERERELDRERDAINQRAQELEKRERVLKEMHELHMRERERREGERREGERREREFSERPGFGERPQGMAFHSPPPPVAPQQPGPYDFFRPAPEPMPHGGAAMGALMFELLDLNNDGSLSRSEFQRLMQAVEKTHASSDRPDVSRMQGPFGRPSNRPFPVPPVVGRPKLPDSLKLPGSKPPIRERLQQQVVPPAKEREEKESDKSDDRRTQTDPSASHKPTPAELPATAIESPWI